MKQLDVSIPWHRNNAWTALAGALALQCLVAGCSTADQARAPAPTPVPTERNYESQMPAREAFDRYMADLQRNPTDYIARSKIIQIYPTLDPRPAKPPETDIWVGQAKAAMKNATGPGDFGNAAEAYYKANTLAPWVPAYYYNAAVACEKAGYQDSAAGWYEWYLITSPNDPDAASIRQHMGELKYAAAQAARFQAVLKSVASRTWTFTAYNGLRNVMWRAHINIVNGRMLLQLSNGVWVSAGEVTPTLECSIDPQTIAAHWYHYVVGVTYRINPDFSSILETETHSDGSVLTRIYQ